MARYVKKGSNAWTMDILNRNLDYERPIKLAADVYWVGYTDVKAGFHCNPYLLVDGDEAVLIDGGSRPDFSTVMMKIMETGVEPKSISTLIYHHYDPDLCGNIPNLEDLIGRPDLRIISHRENNIFIRHYAVRSRLECVQTLGYGLKLKSGRELRFIMTPYSHSAGSFVTYDEKTDILFSSDLFGSYEEGKEWELFKILKEPCRACDNNKVFTVAVDEKFLCKKIDAICPLPGIFNFHRRVMTSNAALRHSLAQMQKISPTIVAPQHGSILPERKDIDYISSKLSSMEDIGIDGILSRGENG